MNGCQVFKNPALVTTAKQQKRNPYILSKDEYKWISVLLGENIYMCLYRPYNHIIILTWLLYIDVNGKPSPKIIQLNETLLKLPRSVLKKHDIPAWSLVYELFFVLFLKFNTPKKIIKSHQVVKWFNRIDWMVTVAGS